MACFVALQRKASDLPTIVCMSCFELCYKRNVRNIGDFYPNATSYVNDKWEQLLDHQEKQGNKYGDFICDYCYTKFKTEKTLPPTCILNGLQVPEVPVCISRLNEYENMLIQRAKAFQVVYRMGAVSGKNMPRQNMIQKFVGRTFHMPLPLEQTLKKMPKP